jgi:hypothetical protein
VAQRSSFDCADCCLTCVGADSAIDVSGRGRLSSTHHAYWRARPRPHLLKAPQQNAESLGVASRWCGTRPASGV